MKFAIQAERATRASRYIYMREHDDGTRSWTCDGDLALTFKNSHDAIAYAQRHTNMACQVVRL